MTVKLTKTQIEILTALKEGCEINFQVYLGFTHPQKIYILQPDKLSINVREMTFRKLQKEKLIESISTKHGDIQYSISQAGLEALASLEVVA